MSLDVVVIGGGNMGAALLGGLIKSGAVAPRDVGVVEPSAARRDELASEYPGVGMFAEVPAANSAIIAVKPQHVAEALTAATAVGVARVLSVAAGVTTNSIAVVTGDGVAIIRAMPNTPALVGQGMTAIAAGPGASADDLTWATSMLAGTGMVVEVAESHLDAITGLTGSGPAYLFLVAESLIRAGLAEDLPAELVEPMVTQLFVGTASLLAERGDPGALRTAVTSPGGTTAAGLAVLQAGGFEETIMAAVKAATHRSRELGA